MATEEDILDEYLPAGVLPDEEFVSDTTTEYNLLFPVIPAEDDPYPPDEQGGAFGLIDDIADQAGSDANEVEDEDNVDEIDELAWDWDAGELYLSTGAPYVSDDTRVIRAPSATPLVVSGDDSLVEWVIKALNTEKGEYAIYSDGYGSEIRKLIGSSLGEPVLYAELERTIIECVEFHPNISRCEIDAIERMPQLAPDALFVAITFYIDGEEDPVSVEVNI
jgi:hypothetical protein